MGIEHVIAFNLTLLAAFASPGPALLYAMRSTLAGGRAMGVATGCGLATMAAIWTLTALVGLDSLFRLFPWAYTTVKIGGALYLIYLAWTIWRNANSPIGRLVEPKARAFLGGVLVNLANPKSVLFSASILVVIFPQGLSLADKTLIVGNHLAVEILAYGAVALLFSTPAVGRKYLRAKATLDRISSLVLGALGLRLLASD